MLRSRYCRRVTLTISSQFEPGYIISPGNEFKLAKLSSNQDINKYCYTITVLSTFGIVSHFEVVSSQSICAFKSRLRPANFDQLFIIFFISFHFILFVYSIRRRYATGKR